MPISINDGGTWKEATNVFVKDGASWKEVQSGQVNDGGTWKEFHAAAPASQIPAGWTEVALSTAVAHPTGSEYDSQSGIWTWRGAGDDIWGNDDKCVFIYRTFDDGETIDVTFSTMILEGGALGDLEQYSGAYLMARETLDANSVHYSVGTNPNAGRWQQKRRTSTNNSTQETNYNPTAPEIPAYFRITRSGGVLTTYYSEDGISYTAIGDTPTIGVAQWYVGVAVNSHDDATPDYLISTGTLTVS